MDRVLADKFSYVVKEIWRIRTEMDRLTHSVIELTAMTDEEIRKADTQEDVREDVREDGTGKEEEDKMGKQDT